MNCDNCKKKFPLFVPYVTVFLNNFLHLLLNRSRCDVKLKPILIDCSVFYFTGFRFHAFSRTFPFCCCFFSWLSILSQLKKMVRVRVNLRSLSQNLSSDKGTENLLWPMDYTARKI